VSRKDELRVAALLNQRRLRTKFTGKKYHMPWGEADDFAEIRTNCLVFLEVERSQNHTTTNVLKYWPLLQDRHKLKIVLAHAFFRNSRAQSGARYELTGWVARKMESKLKTRFTYCRLIISDDFSRVRGIGKLKQAISYHLNPR